ncbi:methylmalonyl-CoA mutase family protein [Acidobacteriia bacterium AH_259_A11_L15]|nr:methylmalonyl-CoA mutase family protein [Acidobacteriia bacterium AH_259_A11_L15]
MGKPTTTEKQAPAERKQKFETSSHIEVKRLYTPQEVTGLDWERVLGYPGEFPYTRGVYPTMYRGRLWTMRQYAGYGTAAESNRRFRYLLEQGQTGLSVAFDLPTQIGYDSDHPQARGEVGRVGVAIDSLEDMERLFDGIPLDQVSTSMTINATAAILLALYVAAGKRQGVEPRKLSGTIQNDILKEYIARGTYIYPPRAALRLVTDIIAYSSQELPGWNSISISGYHIREAGSNAVQEVAFTLANALTYVQAAVDRGLRIDEFAPRLSFFFNAHSNFFEEVAKFRAARRLWARLIEERYRPKDKRSTLLRFHAQTAGSTLTAQQPDVNLVRTSLEALAAVLGGCQSLHCNAKDEALGLPAEDAALLALRTQQVIAHESGVADTVDPLGGSYFVESLTEEIELRAREYLERIEGMGGMLTAVEKGYVQREIQQAAFEHQEAVESGDRVVVGVNRYPVEEETSVPALQLNPQSEQEQVERLGRVRQRRDARKVQAALAQIEEAARGSDNLLPLLLEAVEACATVGEISDALRRVFGEYKETVVV